MQANVIIAVTIASVAVVVSAAILGGAYKYKYHAQQTVTVTGLGETEFVSDQIVWRGNITVEAPTLAGGYKRLEADRAKVVDYIVKNGIEADKVVFQFVTNYKTSEPVYNNGNYAGQRYTGYNLTQQFNIEGRGEEIETVEDISRGISALIAEGIQIESWQPDYYYSKLDDLKLSLIERATADARLRAEKIAVESGSGLGKLKSARMGVFQITGANTNEEFSAGGNFNTSSKTKKARITMRLEYITK
ncbi:MAG: SIMPL domain-containing protein [Tidjanibacter sp.]|nr:SIMPL domain-containing protein [Tidjanibacter sp.]